MRFKRTAAIVCLGLVVIVCLLYVGAWSVVQTRQFHAWLEAQARSAGVNLTLGEIRLSFPFDLVVSSIDATSKGSFEFFSKEIRADLNPIALLSGQLSELTLVEPRIRLPLSSSSSGPAPTTPIDLVVRSLTIQNGRVELETGHEQTFTIPRINLTGHELNLGGRSGEMDTIAFLPELDADLRLVLTAAPSGVEARLELMQRPETKAGAGAGPSPPVTSQGELSLDLEPGGSIRVTGSMNFDRFVFGAVTYTGKIDVAGKTNATRDALAIDLQAEATHVTGLTLLRNPDLVLPLSISVTGEFTTRDEQLALSAIRIVSPLTTLTGKATLSLDQGPQLTETVLEMTKVGLRQLQGLVPVPHEKALEGLEGELTARLTLTGRLDPWSFSGALETKATGTAIAGASIRTIEGKIPFAVRPGHLEATNMRLAVEQVGWRPPGQKIDAGLGSLAIKGSARQVSGKDPNFNGQVEFRAGRFATDDGLTAAENVKGTASVEFQLQKNNAIRTELSLHLDAMEFLWHRFFADVKPERPTLTVSTTYDSLNRRLLIQHGRLELQRIGTVELDGQLAVSQDAPVFDLRIRTAGIQMGNFYDFFVRETFKTSQPLIGALELAGTARADVVARGGMQKFSLEGTAQLQGMELRRPNDWRIGPADLTLPFNIQYPERTAVRPTRPAPQAGMAVRGITLGQATIPPFTVFLSLWDNAFTLVRPLEIPLYGGSLMVERLAWQDIVAAPRKFSFSGKIDDISLADMTKDLGWYEFDGSLSGVIPQVNWAEDTLRTDGELEVRVFDGQIKLDELEVRSLGFLPKIKVNVDIRDINLERATKVFEFGTISGILAGKVDGLIISNGQPSQFRADVHSVSRPGVSQWISVEALNKIVVLGSGTGGSAPYGILAGLFDYYRYRNIGFKAQLRNDLLILEGIKSQDGKEFLVEGSFVPPTVNVVSHMQRISFKELVSRLERMAESGPAQ